MIAQLLIDGHIITILLMTIIKIKNFGPLSWMVLFYGIEESIL